MNMMVIDNYLKIFQSQSQYSKDYQALGCAQQWCHAFFHLVDQEHQQEKTRFPISEFFAKISLFFGIIVNNTAHENNQIKENAKKTNNLLQKIIENCKDHYQLNLDEMVDHIFKIITGEVFQSFDQMQLIMLALHWNLVFLKKFPDQLLPIFQQRFKSYIDVLQNHDELVMKQVIEIMIFVSNKEGYQETLPSILDYFLDNYNFQRNKFYTILTLIREFQQPSITIPSFSKYLLNFKQNKKFMLETVEILDQYLMQDRDCFQFRDTLIKINQQNMQQNSDLFLSIYQTWIFNPISVINLCFMCQQYQLAYKIITNFQDEQLTQKNLVLIGKLVTALESPIFIQLRLQLLESQKFPYLIKALNAILMLLPQTNAFNALNQRLHSIQKIIDSSTSNELVFNQSGLNQPNKLKFDLEKLSEQYYQVHLQ